MAKIGYASAIIKELLSNLFKYAIPILNRALGFKAPGSRLCMWLWTLGNYSAYSSVRESDITSFTCSRHISMLLAANVRGCVLVSCPTV